MDFLIADTFADSLARLTGEEQKAAKTTAFDLQLNPANPGMSFHKVERAKDKNFWSVRAGSDLRLIVHKRDASLLLCYVGHHDKAYAWAERAWSSAPWWSWPVMTRSSPSRSASKPSVTIPT
jgi:mRNA-degrading endonuclease RelE of RelBE toxin-antitoxin system